MHQRPLSRSFRTFAGVDLGGGKGKTTALARLDLSAAGVRVTALLPPPLYDADLLRALAEMPADETVIAVDAPLTLPPCLRCTVAVCPGQEACVDPAVVQMRRLAEAPDSRDRRRGKPPVTPYTQRVTEVLLHREHGAPPLRIVPRETLGQGMGPLTARAQHLRRALATSYRLDENLIEVYPRATLRLYNLGQEYKKAPPDVRLELLARLPDLSFAPGVWRHECVKSDHVFDAVICAYTAYRWQRDGWTIPAAHAEVAAVDGWIWAPPTPALPRQADRHVETAPPLTPRRIRQPG